MQSNIWIFIVYFSTEGQGGGPKYEKIQAWLNPAKGRVQGGAYAYDMKVFANFLVGDLHKNGRNSVFQSPNRDKQFRIENTTVTVFIQKFDYGITVF